jgi:hypothetical protein
MDCAANNLSAIERYLYSGEGPASSKLLASRLLMKLYRSQGKSDEVARITQRFYIYDEASRLDISTSERYGAIAAEKHSSSQLAESYEKTKQFYLGKGADYSADAKTYDSLERTLTGSQRYGSALPSTSTDNDTASASGTGVASSGITITEAHYCLTPIAFSLEGPTPPPPSVKTVRAALGFRNTCQKDVQFYACAKSSSTQAWGCATGLAIAGGEGGMVDTFLCSSVDCRTDWSAPIWNAIFKGSGGTLKKPAVDNSQQRIVH